MKVHYNNGRAEKIIDNIIAIQVIGNDIPVVAITERGREYQISLNNIEMILDDTLCESERRKDAQDEDRMV